MYSNILVPVALDHRPTISDAVKAAEKLLSDGGKITALNVMDPVPAYVAQYLPDDQLDRNLTERRGLLAAEMAGAPHVETVAITGHAAQSILDFAAKNDVDCIVVASHDPGLQDYFLGSTAGRVVRHAHCAVHVVR
ncbi:universal stress protein [Actibacterium mucosum KCTC 23349]|uniref:Universal stress protein n=1 Tax=Actibacterium mucosum KCTC 23349 TaxID=1454373 RepID=A0A037ZLC6_9RHOB|nr:universal stress protein [Actibacterium mucosum]KAJ56409.1 universal stress protein [Actibacterium mucosum KCTC 23349]